MEDPLAPPISYTVQYTDCQGKVQSASGTVPAATKPNTLLPAVVTYTLECPVWLSGKVTYKKENPLKPTSPSTKPVGKAKISAIQVTGPKELATGFTDANGGYSLDFDNRGES